MTEQNPIIGDLVEEFREVVLPARGRVRATLWFGRQLASLVRPWQWGAAFGMALGVENLLTTFVSPLGEDDAAALLAMLAAALVVWGVIAFHAARRQTWKAGVSAAMAASAATMITSQAANFVRVVAFANRLQYDGEWASLMSRYHASGMTDLRLFVAVEYAWTTPVFIATLVALGTLVGAISATAGAASRPSLRARS